MPAKRWSPGPPSQRLIRADTSAWPGPWLAGRIWKAPVEGVTSTPVVVPEGQLDSLFGLPLGEFVEARDRLASELRHGGDRPGAAAVKRLRRPTVAAWTVNQLRRRHRSQVDDLLSLGEDLREAAATAMAGKGADEMRAITGRRARAVDRLLERAEELLVEGGNAASRGTLDRVGETLLAATVDEQAAEAVRAGRLERELAPPSGFAPVAEMLPQDPDLRRERPGRRADERVQRAEDAARAAADEARAAEERAVNAERDAAKLEREAARARRAAERARRQADRAREESKRAAERARDARGAAEPPRR